MSKRFYFRLPFTNEKVIVTVDDCDAHLLRSEMWRVVNHNGYIQVWKANGCDTVLYLGREILGVPRMADNVKVFHKNGDERDFRRENLIALSSKEMMAKMNERRHGK